MRAVDTNVLVRLITRDDAKQVAAAEKFVEHGGWVSHLTVQEPEAVAAAVAHFRGRPALGFSDCLVLAIARKAGHLPLGTFDRNLSKLDGTSRL